MVAIVVLASLLSSTADRIITGIEDSAITTQINTLYLLNEHLNPFNITTSSLEGNVMLSGSVSDETQKQLAEDLAMSVKGVGFVDNRIIVINTVVGAKEERTWKQRMADRATSAAVKSRLLMNGEFKGLKIGVATVDGLVTLYGVVPTEEHALSMAKIAGETRGVVEVENGLTVRRKEDSYDAVRGAGRLISDEWLEVRVAKAILINRHLSIREMDVEVDDGIVILSGSVNSEEKRELAAQIADSVRGVAEVRNNILVREGGEVVEPTVKEASEPNALDLPAPPLAGADPLEGGLLSGSEPEVEERVLPDI